MKLTNILVIDFLTIIMCNCIHVSHTRWSTNEKKLSKITDITWNYCDLKCIYLQNYLKSEDFVVLNFAEAGSTNKFADCYVQNSNGTYDYWNTRIKNKMFSRICYNDQQIDMIKSSLYQLESVEGEGIGAQIEV